MGGTIPKAEEVKRKMVEQFSTVVSNFGAVP